MRFLLLIHADEDRVATMARSEITHVLSECTAMTETLKHAGAFLA